MLDIKLLKQNTDSITDKLTPRFPDAKKVIAQVLKEHEKLSGLQQQIEQIKAEKNAFSKKIASLSPAEKEKELTKLGKLTKTEKSLQRDAEQQRAKVEASLKKMPNIPSDKTPIGSTDKDNIVTKTVGSPTKFQFTPRDHMALGELLDIIDTQRAAKVSGSRFGYLKGGGAVLWNALVQYTLTTITDAGFMPFYSPALVRDDIMHDSGYDSYLEGQEAYHLADDGLYLVGTGEHALLPYHRNEILTADSLPRKYTTYSSCFRREAGSYGKDTKGILRVHQFDKQELLILSAPDQSVQLFDELVALQEKIISQLNIPYHLLEVCAGDLPRPSSRVVDLECWIPSEQKYRETHSASNCTDYQSRDNNIRYKSSTGTDYVHILNATAITPRTLIAILENHQEADGSVTIPQVLQPYCLGMKKITPA